MFYIGICDDEKGTCAQLEEWCFEYGKQKGIDIVVDVWYTGESLCENIQNKKSQLDMLFLDIELISTDGIKVGKFLRDELKDLETVIVYISSKRNYAMSLFRIQPIDFLIKPLNKEKIEEVIAYSIILYKEKNQTFEFNTRGNNYKIPYKEIIYFYSDNKKINIVLKTREMQFNGKLRDIANKIPDNFILIHQSYLVNLDYVIECSYELIKMNNGTLLNISKPYRKSVKERIAERQWKRIN